MEKWKDVIGYEGYYEVSNVGNVRRINAKNNRKLVNTKKGYLAIDLWKNGEMIVYKIHRLVAITFIPNTFNKYYVNHKDGNKHNNCVENLEWVTNLENIQHANKTGLYKNHAKGSKNGMAKLNEELALQIYDLSIHKTFPLKKICELYNMSKCVVLSIKNKKTWKHIHQ